MEWWVVIGSGLGFILGFTSGASLMHNVWSKEIDRGWFEFRDVLYTVKKATLA